jgi:hypothetical protein
MRTIVVEEREISTAPSTVSTFACLRDDHNWQGKINFTGMAPTPGKHRCQQAELLVSL